VYFLTKRDPNYSIKGSRDPLGFQVIWQEAGRRIIPHLSTVSNTVRDFQILSIGFALKMELNIPDQEFELYFMRLEQILGYTRYVCYSDQSFNGIERVKKRADGNSFSISNKPGDQLMSSQKAYGIWGKYIRPFIDSELTGDPDFKAIYIQKVKSNPDFFKLAKDLKGRGPEDIYRLSKSKLDTYRNLLDKPNDREKALLERHLLKDQYEGEFLRIVRKKNGFTDGTPLYALLSSLYSESDSEALCGSLEYIRTTECVLSPLNRIFRYLQTRSYWSLHEIQADKYIKDWRTNPDTALLHEPCKRLASLFSLSNLDLVKGLLSRNEEVAEWRNSNPWMQFSDAGLEINHEEGVFFDEDYDPKTESDYSYFLNTFLYLYRQLN